jgi:hypothetical protein
VQTRSGTINQFSIGFGYVWDKVEYDEELDAFVLKEVNLYEGSVVTIGSDQNTHVIRSMEQLTQDRADLNEEIEVFIRSMKRDQQLQARELFTRQIALLTHEPATLEKPLTEEPQKRSGIDYKQLLDNFKLELR